MDIFFRLVFTMRIYTFVVNLDLMAEIEFEEARKLGLLYSCCLADPGHL